MVFVLWNRNRALWWCGCLGCGDIARRRPGGHRYGWAAATLASGKEDVVAGEAGDFFEGFDGVEEGGDHDDENRDADDDE